MENYTFIGFLITCVFGMSSIIMWLVKKVINITKENTEAFKDFRHSINSLENALDNNTDAIKDLRQTIITIKNY